MAQQSDIAHAPFRSIGEVSDALGIKPHVLRYWEEQFPMLRPLKRAGGRRHYRPGDIALVEAIDRLVHREGYTLRGAKLWLEGEGRAIWSGKAAAKAAPPSSLQTAPQLEPVMAAPVAPQTANSPAMIAQLRAIRSRLATTLEATR